MLAPDKSLGLIFQSNLAGQIQRPPDFTYLGKIFDYFSFIQSFNNVLIIGKNSTSMKRFLWLMELRWETKYKSSLHHRLLCVANNEKTTSLLKLDKAPVISTQC
jgi:hypothetical protein